MNACGHKRDNDSNPDEIVRAVIGSHARALTGDRMVEVWLTLTQGRGLEQVDYAVRLAANGDKKQP